MENTEVNGNEEFMNLIFIKNINKIHSFTKKYL